MNASYMDFPKVIAAVHKQIVEVIDARPPTLEQVLSPFLNPSVPLLTISTVPLYIMFQRHSNWN